MISKLKIQNPVLSKVEGSKLTLYLRVLSVLGGVLTQKMQNKAKLKTPQITVSPFMLSTKKTTLRPPQPKNKPKQTHRKVAQASSLSITPPSCLYVTPASSRQFVIPAKAKPRAGIQNNNFVSIRDNSWHKKMTNKPNFLFSKMTVSPYWIAGCWKPKAGSSQKTNPIQTQNVERSEIPNSLRETHIKPNWERGLTRPHKSEAA